MGQLSGFLSALADQGVFVEEGQWSKGYDWDATYRLFPTDPAGVWICFRDVCIEVIVNKLEIRRQVEKLYAPYICNDIKYCDARVIVKSGEQVPTSQTWFLDQKVAGVHIYHGENGGMLTGEEFTWYWSKEFQEVEAWTNNREVTLEGVRIFVDLAIDRALRRRGLVSIHAAALLIGSFPVLLMGESGVGKTTLLMDLISRYAATALADDRVYLDTVRGEAEGYLPGIVVTDANFNDGLRLCLIPPARHFIEAETIRSWPGWRFSPCLLVVLKRRAGQTQLCHIDKYEATKCLAELALAPSQRMLIKEISRIELIDRFDSIECLLGQIPIVELSLSTNFRQAADILATAVTSGNLSNMGKDFRSIIAPSSSVSIEQSKTSTLNMQRGSTPLVIDVFGMPVSLYGPAEVLSKASKEFCRGNLGVSPPIYEIHIVKRDTTVSEDLFMVWRSSPLDLTLWEGRSERRFVFDNGNCIRHLKNEDISIVEVGDIEVAYPLLRAAVSHVAQRLAVRKGWVVFHSGLVSSNNGHSTMIIGPKGSGKSLCCLWLSEAGYNLITDELVAIDPLRSELMALGLKRDISVRMDAAKLFAVKEKMCFPFGGEEKAVLDLPENECRTQWINVVRIIRPTVCNIDKCKRAKMRESEAQRELFRAGIGDCGETPWGMLQCLTFRIAKRTLVEVLYLSKDLSKSRDSVKLLYGVKQ